MATSKEKEHAMKTPQIVSQQEWRLRTSNSSSKRKYLRARATRWPPNAGGCLWLLVDKQYAFDGPEGKCFLLDMFEGRRQLIVYRAFFEPGVFGWPDHACRGCSLGADQVAHLAHLHARDTTLAYASTRASNT